MDAFGGQVTRYLWEQSWQIAALAVLVAGASFLLRHRSAHLRHLLWLVVLAKCLAPPLVSVSLPLLPATAAPAPPGTRPAPSGSAVLSEPGLTGLDRPEPLTAPAGTPVVQTPALRQALAALDASAWLVLVWLFGAVVVLSLVGVKAVRTFCWLHRDRTIPPPELQAGIGSFLRTLGVLRAPRVWLIRRTGQPFVWGLLRGDVYLPESLATAGAEQRRDVLAHEVSHILRCDAAVNLLQVVAQTLYWFHPLVWWVNRQIRVEREKSCDEMAIARLQTPPRDYSRAIVEVLLAEQESSRRIPTLAIAGSVRNIEERIRTMLRPGKEFHRRPSLPAAACVLLLAVLIVPTTLALTPRQTGASETPRGAVAKATTAEQGEDQRLASATNLKQLGLGLLLYATDHERKFPDEARAVLPYLKPQPAEQLGEFLSSDAEYLAAGKRIPDADASGIPLAYDLTLLRTAVGTNVLFADGHVEFVGRDRLQGYGIELPQSPLEIQEVRFEPIHQGKNVVHVTARNTSEKEQILAIHIYTRSPDYGKGGVGWGTPFFATFAPRETRAARFVFKIQGPVTERTYVDLRFYNPEARDRYEYKRYVERRHYASAELPKVPPEQAARPPASPAEAQAVAQAFQQIQGYIQNRQYDQAWERFSKDFRDAEYQILGLDAFRRAMEPEHPMQSAFTWERGDFLKLKPGQVLEVDGVLTLAAALDGQTWLVDFVQQDGQWKLDWIAGYVPKILDIQRQQEQPSTPPAGGNATTGNLKVLDIQFDPLQSGRNAVRLQVQNTSPTEQVFGLDLRAESSKQNWQRQFTKPVKAGQTESLRCEFEITGPLEEASLIRLRFYHPPSASPAALDLNNWFEQHRYTGTKFDRHEVTYGRQQDTQPAPPAPAATSHLKVLDIQFEPLRLGKNNVVRLAVRNDTNTDQTFGVDIRVEAPICNWQRHFLQPIKGSATEPLTFDFEVLGPLTDNGSVRLRFYHPASAEAYDGDQWFEQRKYTSAQLKLDESLRGPAGPVSEAEKQAVMGAFEAFRGHLRGQEYEAAWGFTAKYFRSSFGDDQQKFTEQMSPDRGGALFLGLNVDSVTRTGPLLTLSVRREYQGFKLHFIQEDSRWKLYAGQPSADNWEERVLPKIAKRRTAHFDIYYFQDSTAAREIDALARQKDDGFQEVCRFLGKDSDTRIRLVLFEDGQTKRNTTGHQGAGWAYGNTIVEVYNEEEKLDPYHETAHILTGPLGSPPALFNEGFATYLAERLGTPALNNLGGGRAALHQRAGELKARGDWIELSQLLSFTEIGPARTRPQVAYAEAGSFVKFLIDSYGKDKFLQAYASLQNSDAPAPQQENAKKLGTIFGKSVAELDAQWQKLLSASPERP